MEKDSSKKTESSKPTKAKQTYKIRDVIKKIHRKRIEDEIPVKSNDKDYIGYYQRAVTTIHQNMSREEVKQAEVILDEWNEEGLPHDIQVK